MEKVETYSTLYISTCHITQEASEWLTKAGIAAADPEQGAVPYHMATHAYGYLVWAADEFADEVPQCVIDVCEFAKKHGCTWINIDQDGPEYSDLPHFDW